MLNNGLNGLEIVAVEELTPYDGRPLADDIPSIAVVSFDGNVGWVFVFILSPLFWKAVDAVAARFVDKT